MRFYPRSPDTQSNPSASFIVMLFAPFPSCSTWPGHIDQRTNQSQSKSCIPPHMQKITPIKPAPSYLNIRWHYTTPRGAAV